MTCTPTLQTSVTFAATAVTTLTLKLPDFGNTKSVDLRIIDHRSRNNTLFIYKRGSSRKSKNLSFSGLRQDELEAAETFFEDSRGKIITYTDHFNDAYTGFVKQYTVTENKREYGFDLAFEFELE